MGDELIVRARQNCCRLCLAPDNECISIINGVASDKEPLLNKIYACVNIKISKTDNLSQQICHFCVSYLNSWQSFKNRCLASQKKQQICLDNTLRNVQKQIDDIRASRQNDENFTLPDDQTSTPTNKRKLLPIQIKEEPIFDDDERDETMKVDIDPTDFLARNDEDETEELKRLAANQNLTITKSNSDGGPPILTSLGLTSVMPFNFLSTELGQDQSTNFNNSIDADDVGLASNTTNDNNDSSIMKTAACRVCKLRFSTRANARRHERNIHGRALLQNQSGAVQSSNTITNLQQQQQRTNIKPNIPTHNSNGEPITPEMLGIYEYNKPEKYRHLFTERLLQFIEQHSEFLRQYQNLTCKCCNREYPKYKNFMAHMRKKYPKLPRNLCFKCLTPFETKAHFVSHVKRRNCINYFKLYLLDDTIPKRQSQNVLEKSRARELLTNKLYECKICPKKFRLKLEFRSHVYDDHSEIQKKDVMPGHCAFCGLEIEDPVERKRHYNNMECIVYLRCGTCNEKFDSHTKFLDHVYSEHLPKHLSNDNNLNNTSTNSLINLNQSINTEKLNNHLLTSQSLLSTTVTGTTPPATTFHSRMPQSCKICGQHYNNYNNVLRHMESKHPDQLPQTYKCSITMCNAGFPRLSNLREHMQDIHNMKMAKPKRDMGIYCRMCMEKFDQRQNWLIHQNNDHQRYVCCVCNFQSRDIDDFIEHIEQHPSLSTNRNSGGDNTSDSGGNKSYTGRYDYVMKDLLSITNGSGSGSIGGVVGDGIRAGGGGGDDDNNTDDHIIRNPPKRIKLDTSLTNNITLPGKAECKICHAVFNSNLGLSNHMRAHNAQQEAKRAANSSNNNDAISKPLRNTQVLAVDRRFRRMRCRLCQKRFSTKKIYRRHMLIEHQIQNVQFIHCAVCKAEFAHEKGLKVHMIKVHGKVLKDISEMNLQFECDVCSTVYRTEEQLMSHKKSVHNLNDEIDFHEQSDTNMNLNISNASNNNRNIMSNIKIDKPNIIIPPQQSTNYWYQCRYCASNFDTNKKLAIHINCHDEFDSNDYSCKDCGNVYSGRKSLWVHRYKKHPLIPDPAPCEICHKTFFDRNMLEQHLIHSHKQKINKNNITNIGSNVLAVGNKLITEQQQQRQQQQLQQQQQQQQQINLNDSQLLTTDDDDEHDDGDDESEIDGDRDIIDDNDNTNEQHIIHVSGEDVQTVAALGLPQVPCSVCGMKFSDQDLFTKHMQMHEMMLYTDNPLASMFDTEPEDPDTFLANRINENGEFMCDICPKTFPQLTALKVHRNWHFRSDGKQIPADPNTVWRSTAKKRKNPSATLKCQYCQSSFISSNNLKRHIAELHRRVLAPNTELPDIVLEKPLECTKCSLKFKTNAEWVEHKLNDAKIGKPYAPFEWGCEICGKVVSRKERLIQHMTAHIKDNEPNGHNNEIRRSIGSTSEQDKNNSKQLDRKQTISSSVDEGSVSGAGGISGIKSENGFDESDSDDSSSSSSDSSSTSSNSRNENGNDNTKKSTIIEKSDNVEHQKLLENRKTNLNSEVDDDDDEDYENNENKTKNQLAEDDDEEQPGDEEDAEFDLISDDGEDDNEVDFEDDDDGGDDDDDDDDDEEDDPNHSGPRSCDLCQLDFDTSKQLRKHVTCHFVNGPEESSKASTSTVATAITTASTVSPAKLNDKIKEFKKSPIAVKHEDLNTNIDDIKKEAIVKDEKIHDIDNDEDDHGDDDEDDMINDLEVVKEEFVHDGYEEIEEDGEVIMVPPM